MAGKLTIKPYAENPFYWEVNGKPTVLLGGSVEDNLYQIAGIDEHLELIASVGGNYARCTISWRDDGDANPFLQGPDGRYDLNAWNPDHWGRLEHFLEKTAELGIIIQVELWDPWDYYDARAYRRLWSTNPFHPDNNVNYTAEEVGLTGPVEGIPQTNKNDFFKSVPEMLNNRVLLKYQEQLIDKILSYTLEWEHVLYCMQNETGHSPPWTEYWARHVKKRAEERGKTVYVTEMWRWRNPLDPGLNPTVDHPELYDFIDVSQNNHNVGRLHYDRLVALRQRMAVRAKRPLNNVKIYGGEGLVIGSPRDGVQRFWRNIWAGTAAARFHRPTSGIGIDETAQRQIRAARTVLGAFDIFRCEPRPDLIDPAWENGREAYVLAEPGKQYAVLFPDGPNNNFQVITEWEKGELTCRWYSIDREEWVKEEPVRLGRPLRLRCPADGAHVAVVRAF